MKRLVETVVQEHGSLYAVRSQFILPMGIRSLTVPGHSADHGECMKRNQ